MARNAAIFFEPEAYVLDGPKLMGRQSAGNAFLRAAVYGRDGETLKAYTPRKASAEAFAKLIRDIDAAARAEWIAPGRFDQMAAHGALYVPGPVLTEAARLRLRAGPAAYSLTGVTHTTASHAAMDALAALVSAPLMPWDAVICTSRAVLATTERIIEKEREYLAWRLKTTIQALKPQLPVIPLGVHCRDFEFSEKDRAAARQALGLAGDEVVALFVGRLSFHAKAHPHAMYLGLEAAAKRTGRKVALIQCGWFANDAIATAFRAGAKAFAPSVRALFTDGRNPSARAQSWAAADLFVTLSDNVQETFGLAPIEAMAAGLPVVATDWDGYRDTVRDGHDGYLIPTAMPAPGYGSGFALGHESEDLSYDRYIGAVCRMISVDLDLLADRLAELVASEELRSRLGRSGRERAKSTFEWGTIYKRYQALWAELSQIRLSAQKDPALSTWLADAPPEAPSRLDPFSAFAEYPTEPITPDTQMRLREGASFATYRALTGEFLFGYEPETLPKPEFVSAFLEAVGAGATTPASIAARLSCETASVVLAAAILAKMGVMRISVR